MYFLSAIKGNNSMVPAVIGDFGDCLKKNHPTGNILFYPSVMSSVTLDTLDF